MSQKELNNFFTDQDNFGEDFDDELSEADVADADLEDEEEDGESEDDDDDEFCE